ncbi:hypothetical protein [Rossellomorea aquimaris]|uniref:Uncharacterized protein n=1 Tax=Rossellomorea aquimaris TaxID=189382 RepID=A0A1J6WL57_9BACI|nr:hypothetical protein [Rossellomorea aquimaris]OIU68711.1 hypothetical protein BHE18_17500 [Rossellomorea aquimaris]
MMKTFFYGSLLFIFLILPPVAELLESVMIIHMHMQMPLLIIAGMLMAPLFQKNSFLRRWNENGQPGILLFMLIFSYWLLPRTMDEALSSMWMEGFKFISLPFLAGVPLRDSWTKVSNGTKRVVLIVITLLSAFMGWIYIFSPNQLCNNYLIVEQVTLGWGFWTMGLCISIYIVYDMFSEKWEESY